MKSQNYTKVLYQLNLFHLAQFFEVGGNQALIAYFYLNNGLRIDPQKNISTPCRKDSLEYLFGVVYDQMSKTDIPIKCY
jgi:hypothetical protein